ncbi:restriction endonuclease [candidate division WWE3 bacterium CG08_land_8_20_14_0_20_41_10]|uniref:Restriction endonuclease n=1 Tax=candidate division WWE3 bacterium CG08_land_8_20_14_0_20_41_10 TaxID=1975085 RepID=A0A2H0XBF2_UNCKA|nr:MAG: restriction endonuclease [candidate division WWE3 bacterium CG08_land_8_20_14_0_20_41_10]
MDLRLPLEVGARYTNRSQTIRVMSETWVGSSIFCPNCGNNLTRFQNNKPVADFYCKNCTEQYELKSKNGHLGIKIIDGAYSTMIQRLSEETNPNLFLLTYNTVSFDVTSFLAIPNYFFSEEIIEKRNPLAENAKRAGWIGCNIAFKKIPELGKIYYVRNGEFLRKDKILENWNQTIFVKESENKDARGWTLDTLICVEKINKIEFTLEDIYQFKDLLRNKHPQNNNIEAKIRQQLRLLRDKNIIDFTGRGRYKIRSKQYVYNSRTKNTTVKRDWVY